MLSDLTSLRCPLKGHDLQDNYSWSKGKNVSEEDLRRAQIEQEAVEFSERLAIENPGMFEIEEMKELIERHDKVEEITDKAISEDFASMPPAMQEQMKEMLKASDVSEEVWKEIFGEDF